MPAFREFPLTSGVESIPGEPRRFFVASRTSTKRYLVDLDEAGFNGACSCENYQFKRLPKLKRRRREGLPPETSRCWHIERALIFYAEINTRLDYRHERQRALEQQARAPVVVANEGAPKPYCLKKCLPLARDGLRSGVG